MLSAASEELRSAGVQKLQYETAAGEAKEQCSVGFQPVPRDHCAWPCVKNRQTTREWLDRRSTQAYATLLPALTRTRFKSLSKQY